MDRISLSRYINLGAALTQLTNRDTMVQGPHDNAIFNLYRAKEHFDYLLNGNNFLSIRVARPEIENLVEKIQRVLSAEDEAEVYEKQKVSIWLQSLKVETLLNGELAVQAVYHVSPKRAYDIDLLISDGTKLFSKRTEAKFTEDERYNFDQAGKCLAFQVPTAAAFHIFRGVESVIRRYYKSVSGNEAKLRYRNWDAYIKNLTKFGADEKILALLDQIRKFYRNPIAHPDTNLTIEDALSLIGLADTEIEAMSIEMAQRASDQRQRRNPNIGIIAS